MTGRTACRHGQGGQMLMMVAVMSLVLIGAGALAVDLSVNTHARRSLQNITDASALGGGRDLPSNQSQGLKDALDVLQRNSPWSSDPNWLSNAQGAVTCNSGTCTVSVDGGTGYSNYHIQMSSPPSSPQNTLYSSSSYLEVDMTEDSKNSLGGVIGFGTSHEKGHSIAWHRPGNTDFGFALYAAVLAESGNQVEIVKGDVYADRKLHLQSGGQAGFCADRVSGANGNVVLGYPQINDAGYANDGQYNDVHDPFITPILPPPNPPSCPASVSNVEQTGVSASGTCPTISGTVGTLKYNSLIKTCVLNPPPGPPSMPEPRLTLSTPYNCLSNKPAYLPGIYSCFANGKSALTAAPGATFGLGVYKIAHNPSCIPKSCYDVDLTGSGSLTLSGVTFWLELGATIGVEKGVNLTWSPYNSGKPPGPYAIYATAAQPVPPTSNCANSPSTNENAFFVDGTNTTVVISSGTMYMPTGEFNEISNGSLQIQSGQAIVEDWCTQSGNHPNPEIAWSSATVAPLVEVLQLVE